MRLKSKREKYSLGTTIHQVLLPYSTCLVKIPSAGLFSPSDIMEKVAFTAQVRAGGSKAARLRKMNLIPAQYYGRGVENLSLQMDYQGFRKLFKKAGRNTVIDLEIEGNGTKNVLIHQVDLHPVTDRYAHVEFTNVRMDEAVTTTVPIRLEGVAPAVRDMEGVLLQSLDEIEISCLPADLIHEVVLNVESLVDFNTTLHVSDLKISDKIKIFNDPSSPVATVSEPQKEEEVALPAEAATAADVEITTEKKEGEPATEGAASAAAEEKKKE